MAVEMKYIKHLIGVLGFKMLNGPKEIWEKQYENHENYRIQINFDKKIIIYEMDDKDKSISVCSKTTSNFSSIENFVVLECVDRLLEKGYKPNSIELEHSWPSGHGTSGRLDILVKKENNPYLMIECKNYGSEFEKEEKNMLTTKKINGGKEEVPKGQLFSYVVQEKTTEYLCLYTSRLKDQNIEYKNSIIPVDKEWSELSNQKEVFDYWNKNFKHNGIFENTIKPYNIECKSLIRSELLKITNEDSNRIFAQFLEILRHNAVSDKPNAFNKVLNLFICKIVDEDRNDDEELQFQWKDDSTYISLQSNLEDLYKKGMDKFLEIEVTDYSEADIESKLSLFDDSSKLEIKKIFQELRLQKNPEFAFKEVYNNESFEENAKVVKEVVELLQPYQFRYGHKQQFLGNFFELLLNTSIKQEAGQFFTPVPIAKFMISCLPIEGIIEHKIKKDKGEILPNVIDYACGSGHFITEWMDVVQSIINSYDTKPLKKSIKNTIEKWKQYEDDEWLQGEFEWAKDYVYGIEKDYRLVKTSKISTFLNGDGDANIIHADGLDKFNSVKYKGKLLSNSNINEKFDCVIANPPYSVSSFKQTLNCNEDDFELYDMLTPNSSEIECMFIERTKQLLREGGCASIILPASILTNTGLIYEKTREHILKNFYVKAICKMGSNTFMATDTNTIILFIEKRKESDYYIVENLVNGLFNTFKDFSYNGMTDMISKYINEYIDEILFEDYISLINHKPTEIMEESKYYKALEDLFKMSIEYKNLIKKSTFKNLNNLEKEKLIKNLFNDFIDKIEKRKLIFYLLTSNQKTLLIHTGEKQKEKEFLGYEFSSRRGYEGIHYYTDDNGNIESALYDEEELHENPLKVSYYINKSFNNEYPEIIDMLNENIKLSKTNRLLNFTKLPFELSISLTPNFDVKIESKFDKELLKDICFIQKGTSITEKQTIKGEIPVIAGGKNPAYYHNISNREKEIITISASGANAGYINYWEEPIFASDCTTIKSKNNSKVLTKYIYIVLKAYQKDIYMLQKGQGQPHVYPDDLGNIKMPVPPIDIQEEIINEYKDILNEIECKNEKIYNAQQEIIRIREEIFMGDYNKDKIKTIAKVSRGASPRPIKSYLTKQEDGVNWIKIGDVKVGEKYITKTKQKIKKEAINKSVFVKEGDFVISNSMSFGRPYILKTTGCIHDGWLLISDISESILNDYLYYILLSDNVQNQFKEKANGSTVENLNIERVEQVIIPIPLVEQQKSILQKIKIHVDKIEKMENEIKELIDKKSNIVSLCLNETMQYQYC